MRQRRTLVGFRQNEPSIASSSGNDQERNLALSHQSALIFPPLSRLEHRQPLAASEIEEEKQPTPTTKMPPHSQEDRMGYIDSDVRYT